MLDLSVVDGPYLRDILDQPRALQATFENLKCSDELESIIRKLRDGSFCKVVLTGMGSSFHALHPTQIQLIQQGYASIMVETSELIHYHQRLFDPRTLIIAVSQSGQSAEMLRLVDLNQRRSEIIAVTNTANSPLATDASAAIVTEAGQEFSVSCKTYVSALLALQWLTEVICHADIERSLDQFNQISDRVHAYLQHWKSYTATFAQTLDGIRNLFLVGRGSSLAAVCTGALIIKESAHFPAEGMSSASFRHGPFEMISDETFVLVFAGDEPTRDLNRRLLRDIYDRGGRGELVEEDARFSPCTLESTHPSTRPIMEILPVQMLTLALAARMRREPGRFEFATKVTSSE